MRDSRSDAAIRTIRLCSKLIVSVCCLALAWAAEGDHLQKGLDLAEAGDLKGAEAELRLAIAAAPNNPGNLATLGSILGMEYKSDEASTYFEKALKIDPSNVPVRRNLAASQWQSGRLREAAANCERILKLKPGDPPAVLLLGMVTENLKDYAKAADLLGTVPDLVKQRPESIAALARSYYHIGQKEKARKTLTSLPNPSADPEGVFLGGDIASQEGDVETALKLFESIRSTYPDAAALNYSIALATYRGGHYAEAEAMLVDLIRAGKPTSAMYNLLAWSYYKQNKSKETVVAMDQAIALEPSKEKNYLDLGNMMADHRSLTVARAVADKAVEEVPDSYRAHMLKGLIAAEQGDYAVAVASYRRAVELKPDSSEPIVRLAKMQSLAGMQKEAAATFEHGIKDYPRDASIYVEYALVLLQPSERPLESVELRAVSLLRQAIVVDKSLSEPHYQLGKLWLAKGRISEAVKELEAASKLNPKEGKTHFALARVYRRLGRSKEAATEMVAYEEEKAHEGKPE